MLIILCFSKENHLGYHWLSIAKKNKISVWYNTVYGFNETLSQRLISPGCINRAFQMELVKSDFDKRNIFPQFLFAHKLWNFMFKSNSPLLALKFTPPQNNGNNQVFCFSNMYHLHKPTTVLNILTTKWPLINSAVHENLHSSWRKFRIKNKEMAWKRC